MRIVAPGGARPGAAYSDYPVDARGSPEFLIGPPKPAAVLVPLTRIANVWHVVYIRRASNENDHHSGQVAFPGGRYEPDDRTLERAALREAHEEIGLQPGAVQLLGRLAPYLTITNFSVTPVIGRIPWPYLFEPQAEEVSRVFTIPLTWLADPANHELRPRTPAVPGKPVNVVYFRRYDGELLWGATARMTLSVLDSLRWD